MRSAAAGGSGRAEEGSRDYAVSFSVNACPVDAPYLDRTVRHMVRALAWPFTERVVAFDPGAPRGRFRDRPGASCERAREVLHGLLADSVIDRVDEVPWDDETRDATLARHFGDGRCRARDDSGGPVYQFLFALDRCRGDYVLHVDADVLFHCNRPGSWIAAALEVMRADPRVVLAAPHGGPPQARNPIERLLNTPVFAPKRRNWNSAATVSTRCFLLDRPRYEEALLPLQPAGPAAPLEESLALTLRRRGLTLCWVHAHGQWQIHPPHHDENFLRHLPDLIWAVEQGVYPFVRGGNRWDLCTDGSNIEPWLAAIRRARGQALP